MIGIGWQREDVRKAAQETLAKKVADGIHPYWPAVKKIDREKERKAMQGVNYE